MAKVVANGSQESSKLYQQVTDLEKKEKKAYEALAALMQFVKMGKKLDLFKIDEYNDFKKAVLAGVADFDCRRKSKLSNAEPKFNVKHYERAILCASDATYRDMAIQAASKDLTEDARLELILALRRDCCQISRQLKELASLIDKKHPVVEAAGQLWQNVVDSVQEKERKPITV